jgi:hypothetical protein
LNLDAGFGEPHCYGSGDGGAALQKLTVLLCCQ